MTTEKPKRKRQGMFDATGWWVLFATISASSMAFIMQSALNVALPAIQREFGASGADQVWIINAYQLLLSAFLLLGGSLGDLYGRKRIYMAGIVLFTVACVACGLAPNTRVLILARAVQGIGGALMIPGSLALISAYFDESVRGRAIGTWSAFTTGASLAAPLIGGIFADAGLWRVIFFLCVPFAAAALYALARHVPESRDDQAPAGIDYAGAALIAIALMGIVYGTTEIGRGGEFNFNNPVPFVTIIIGVVSLIAFIFVESRSTHPMMPLRLFRSRTFSGVNVLTLFLYGALGVAFFFVPLNLQQIQGYSALLAGLSTMPITLALMFLSPVAGTLIDRMGPRPPLIAGPLIVGVGFAALGLVGVTDGPAAYWTTYFPGFLIIGLGMGITVAPLTTAALGSVPQHNAGVASAINNLMSRASGALAMAILGGLALISFSANLQANIATIDLSPAAEVQLMENSRELAGTSLPDLLSDEATITAVDEAIDVSFVGTFQLMMFISAAMAWFSAAVVFFMVAPVLSSGDEKRQAAAASGA